MLRFAPHLFALIALFLSPVLNAEPGLRIAVASNFSKTANALFADYQRHQKIRIVPMIGSTGKHTAQIQQGLAVDIFLAADSARPQWLEVNGLAVVGSRFTYAIGRLAVFSLNQSYVDALKLGSLKDARLAIANPKLAPYGIAAMEFLEHQKDIGESDGNLILVTGDSVAQAFQFAASGAAEAALIAYSQTNSITAGYFSLIADELHKPIEQQAVIIRPSADAESFMDYLQSESAQLIIQRSGYQLP
jgi:molybdate transport system substrate-binding protein